ncbi:MAG TPA: hypothetical protein VFI02_12185 [Armatimonadota bacterium]|nr:hypothetical protein [Armatimonadota bacterium]
MYQGENQATTTEPILDDDALRYIADCAARCAADYDQREDLISDTVTALLEYDGHIEHPKGFIRTTVRNLAINQGVVGPGAREISNSDLDLEGDQCSEINLSDLSVLRDTLDHLLERLTPAEAGCYNLLKAGYEQRDLPKLLGISRQTAFKLLAGIRRKYLSLEMEGSD